MGVRLTTSPRKTFIIKKERAGLKTEEDTGELTQGIAMRGRRYLRRFRSF
jgi:hypothetical protein